MLSEHDGLRRKNEELAQAYKEKSRKLLQTQELYDKVKRKAEMGQIQRAASDAVDSTLHYATQQGSLGFEGNYQSHDTEDDSNGLAFSQAPRFDSGGNMNTGIPRVNPTRVSDEIRWPRPAVPPRSKHHHLPRTDCC